MEYYIPSVLVRITQIIGEVDQMDRRSDAPTNTRYARIRVRINPRLPLMDGCYIRRDDSATYILKVLAIIEIWKRKHLFHQRRVGGHLHPRKCHIRRKARAQLECHIGLKPCGC